LQSHRGFGNSGFRVLRNKMLDHRIHEIVKSDLPKYKEGEISRNYLLVQISQKGNRRAIVESSSGQWKKRNIEYMDF
jgi:hypothetical protein